MQLEDRWDIWKVRLFPREVAATEVETHSLMDLHSLAGGCLDSFFRNGVLDAHRREVLARCVGFLHKALPELEGDTRQYFGELTAIGGEVLHELR